MSKVWLNGSLVDDSDAAISLRDTGLLHGAGVFTTMRAYNGKVFRLDQHLARIRQSCEALFIPLQHRDDVLRNAIRELLDANDLSAARLRLTVTRGMARQDPLHGVRLEPNAFITVTELEPYPAEFYERGLTVIVLDEQKLNPYDMQAGHKTINYFSRLAALRSANQRGAGEALWFNVHNYLESGSITNAFVVKNQTLITPPTPADLRDRAIADATPYPRSAVLPGVTRTVVLDLAAQNSINTRIGAITINDLLEADEAFITNSVMGIMPVCRIERKPLGDDRPGPVTQRLSALYEDAIRRETSIN